LLKLPQTYLKINGNSECWQIKNKHSFFYENKNRRLIENNPFQRFKIIKIINYSILRMQKFENRSSSTAIIRRINRLEHINVLEIRSR
jgi:hypothetical protein